ncbi:MAG: 3-dehydroquinate synthase [Clostridia bacterium]|nr:3-dehydroquinate synthase [Clostridia bacterium]
MRQILLKAPSMTANIYIGNEVLSARLPTLTRGQKNFVLTDSNVYALYPDFFKTYFAETEIFVLQAGEEYKTFSSLQAILERMATAGLLRTSRLFAVGGGVVGDIGGLAAALYMRGISCVQIPTTLLSQVDSSVGGKTAVDLCGVKNIVGAFYQPCEVLIDPTFLKTLPAREIKCGVGEIVKYAAISGKIFRRIYENLHALTDLDFLTDLIYDCVAHKARVVEIDEKETGERKSLNVGHTTGHAVELSHGLSHGESVLYGMLLETKIAISAGVCERAYGEKLLKIIRSALALAPVSSPDFSDIEKDAEKAKSDKKNAGDGAIKTSVAKTENEWTLFSLPFEDYKAALKQAAQDI